MNLRPGVWLGALVGFAVSACTLASPTHINVEPTDPSDSSSDITNKSPSPSASASSTPPPAAGTCSGTFTKVSTAGLTPCGGGKAHCYDKTKVPPGGFFSACPDASQVCVEDSILAAGGAKLKSCTSIIGPGGCIDLSILNVPDAEKQQATALKQDVCDSGDICAPCTDPTNNNAPTPFCQPIGVFDKPCDSGSTSSGPPPSTTTSQAQTCCTTNGKSNGICIASSAIPEGQKGSTIKDTCTGDNQCVPASLASGKPVTCDSGLLGRGVCIDKCFSSMMGFASEIGFLSGNGCGSTEVCVPCIAASAGGGGTAVPGCN
jgi:hypothetical protein